jgi:hypothetical protein
LQQSEAVGLRKGQLVESWTLYAPLRRASTGK